MAEHDINKVTTDWRLIMEDSNTLKDLLSEEKYDAFLALTEARLIKIEQFFEQYDENSLPDALMETIITDIESIRAQDTAAMDMFSRDQTQLVKLFKDMQTGKKGIKQYQGH